MDEVSDDVEEKSPPYDVLLIHNHAQEQLSETHYVESEEARLVLSHDDATHYCLNLGKMVMLLVVTQMELHANHVQMQAIQ